MVGKRKRCPPTVHPYLAFDEFIAAKMQAIVTTSAEPLSEMLYLDKTSLGSYVLTNTITQERKTSMACGVFWNSTTMRLTPS